MALIKILNGGDQQTTDSYINTTYIIKLERNQTHTGIYLLLEETSIDVLEDIDDIATNINNGLPFTLTQLSDF